MAYWARQMEGVSFWSGSQTGGHLGVHPNVSGLSPEQGTEGGYVVVVNHEGQYSIWPSGRTIPAGWSEAGRRGTKEECLEHIASVWTDMRPLSLRRQMDADEPSPSST